MHPSASTPTLRLHPAPCGAHSTVAHQRRPRGSLDGAPTPCATGRAVDLRRLQSSQAMAELCHRFDREKRRENVRWLSPDDWLGTPGPVPLAVLTASFV